jgi:hypothetical protein
VVRATSPKLGLHIDNIKYNTEKEEARCIPTIVCVRIIQPERFYFIMHIKNADNNQQFYKISVHSLG